MNIPFRLLFCSNIYKNVVKWRLEAQMKKFLIIKMIILLIGILGFSFIISSQPVTNKQYVEVTLKSGDTINFEYRTFLEGNLSLLPERLASIQSEGKTFGERRVIFREKDSCVEHKISLDNLETIEILGVETTTCGNEKKKDWLVKVSLLDLDRYVGFFESGESNLDKPASLQAVVGTLLNSPTSKAIPFEDIKKISFYAR